MPVSHLRQLELHLDGGAYPEQERKSFLLSARCCCNYLERRLRTLRFPSRYSRLIVLCTRNASDVAVTPLKHEPYLEAVILFDAKPRVALSVRATHEQVIRALLAGMVAASKFAPMPLHECRSALAEFAGGGFVNRWTAREKSWSRKRCRAEVAVEMTLDRVTLDQRVYIEGELVAEARLAESVPREGLYERYLGEFVLDARARIVYRVGNKPQTVFDLGSRRFVRTATRSKPRRNTRS